MRRLWLSALGMVWACSAVETPEKKPFGVLPSATTTAEPLWIPFTIRAGRSVEADPRERHLSELRQITSDGKSGGAAWSADGKRLLVEAARGSGGCGTVVEIDLASGVRRPVSPEAGWARHGAYHGERVVFAYSAQAEAPCGPSAVFGGGMRLWPSEIRSAGPDPGVFAGGGYDAELSAGAGRLLFTSSRDGDLEIYATDQTGQGARRISHEPGYDGGAAIAPDGSAIAWHGEHLGAADIDAHRQAIAAGTIVPRSLQIYLAGPDGQHARAVVRRQRYNVTPTFLPDARRLLFASNWDAPPAADASGLDLYLVHPDGPATATGEPAIERITLHPSFDGEPRFSPNGRYLAFTSGRGSSEGGSDVFVARWID